MPSTQSVATAQPPDGGGESSAPPPHWQCAGCSRWYPDGCSCEVCVTCDHCEAPAPQGETVTTARGSTICDQCRQDWYRQCASCEEWNYDGDECANGCCDPDCGCEDCRDIDVLAVAGLVHDYSYKPAPRFHGTGPLFLGPEIEIETPRYRSRACAEIAHGHLGRLGYLKADSSIGSGFEIVTHPMSYEWAIANFPWPMLTDLREAGCSTSDNTGIHVHVSRAGFASTGHTYRWMKFVYRNEPQVTALARRSCTRWAAFTDHDRRAVKDYAKGARGQRYRAINTNNADTFELRIFASSLNLQEVQAALGFAAASIEYTRHLTVGTIAGGGWAWSAFAGWLTDQPAYAPLRQQLEALRCVC